MKKFISMVMAAAMVVSLVPATAFAASGSAVFKCVDAIEVKEEDQAAKNMKNGINGPQGQIIITDLNGKAGSPDTFEIEVELDNAEFAGTWGEKAPWWGAYVSRTEDNSSVKIVEAIGKDGEANIYMKDGVAVEDTSATIVIEEDGIDFKAGDVIILPIENSIIRATSVKEGTVITATVTGDFGESEPLTIASVLSEAIDVTVAGKPVEVAQETEKELKKITIESVVTNFISGDEVKVRVSKGWEITDITDSMITGGSIKDRSIEEDEFVIVADGVKAIKIDGMEVEAISADPGDECVITVSCKGYEGDSDVAAVVIADAVIMSVDEDEDVPVFYNGVNVNNDGLQDTDEHKALTITIEETVADTWDEVDKWTLTLPEGVYAAAGTTVTGNNTFKSWKNANGPQQAWELAYEEGDYEAFEFGRRAFERLDKDTKLEITLDLVLVAEPGFVGDVVVTLEGAGISEEAQEVVVATFVAPYTVEAAQNDLVIDYKETKVPTVVTITEAEMGLWDDNTTRNERAEFAFYVEDITVEDAEVAVDEASDMTIEDKTTYDKANAGFYVDEESDEEAAVVTLSEVELYMERNIPAGAYDLKLASTLYDGFLAQPVFGAVAGETEKVGDILDEVAGATVTVKEGWINVITAGRDKDDASFTKTVVVPVGAMEIVAGEEVVALDVPAYINAAGYTMLPVRAVAVALGIHTNNVIWDQATKTVTILYGQRIITMQVGSKVINVNGSAIPASAAVEIVNGRTFLGLRDLATALGVTDITWDAATQTATLNGNK